jgi:hypothetical protein
MRKNMNTFTRVFFLVGVAGSGATADAILNYTETDLGGGFYDVVFTSANGFDPVADAGVDLYDIVFDFPVSGFLLSLPSGWTSNPPSSGTSVEAFSTFPGSPPSGTDIAPAQSLSGFEFLFETPLGDIPFTYSFTNPAEPSQPLIVNGTSSSTSVPEASNTVLVGTAITLIWLSAFLSGLRKSPPMRPSEEDVLKSLDPHTPVG